MPSIIDNRERTMIEALKNSLQCAESIDILTAYFYFSGFDLLADELKDKKIRILIGKEVDPTAIDVLCQATKQNGSEDLDAYSVRGFDLLSRGDKKKKYTDGFCELFNKSSLSDQFDSSESQKVFKMFVSKLEDGSLEMRLFSNEHAKAYILTNKPEFSFNGDQKGVVFFGSSNFTYNGLCGQGEINERFSDNVKYDEYHSKFEDMWKDSRAIDICVQDGNKSFIDDIKKRLWIYSCPEPYKIFIRILDEMFSTYEKETVKTPSHISGGKFENYKYQLDAIKFGIDCLNKNNGVIIADVVGLGKSIIAAAIAYNLNFKRTVIIAPPHLVDQWEEYQQDFALRGVRVFSSGRIEEVYAQYASEKEPVLYIIDEAHRYRNENTDRYKLLHQLTRSNADNKVILLTATPYNNRPQDLFALVKLFQSPSKSTINTVENLGYSFRSLIKEYNFLEGKWKKGNGDRIKQELNNLSGQLRDLISPVIIRRSRIDLQDITEYADDLSAQHIEFPEVVGPELVEYDLGSIRPLYMETLEALTTDFKCVRYNPSDYFTDPKAINSKYGVLLGQMNIELMTKNLSVFIKNMLVMRFESSKAAFKITLENIIKSYENIVKWWEIGYVPIQKHGYFEDPDMDEIQEILDEINSIANDGFNVDKIKKKAIPIEVSMFKPEYIDAVNADLDTLEKIFHKWFETGDNQDDEQEFDPKYNVVSDKLRQLLSEMPERKIVIFSTYADTAEYVQKRLGHDGFRAFLYTGGSNKSDRNKVRSNFDASFAPERQANDFDIIVATDALSEGFNLNRAGVVINYDIPYNPTRVVQRIGRINRINKKMFEKIYIFNFFPTEIGEKNTAVKVISTLKMYLINNIVGSDTRTLTPDETLQSYFKNEYDRADKEYNERSWDVEYKNIYNSVKNNAGLMEEIRQIPERVRIVRKGQNCPCTISFSKRGDNCVFAVCDDTGHTEIESPETVLKLFNAEPDEKGYETDDDLNGKFENIRNEMFRPYTLEQIKGNKSKAYENLKRLRELCGRERDYLTDLMDVIKKYDDLTDGELKYIANLKIEAGTASRTCEELKKEVPEHYLSQIMAKAEKIDSRREVVMFTEGLRKDDN